MNQMIFFVGGKIINIYSICWFSQGIRLSIYVSIFYFVFHCSIVCLIAWDFFFFSLKLICMHAFNLSDKQVLIVIFSF